MRENTCREGLKETHEIQESSAAELELEVAAAVVVVVVEGG